MFNFVKPSFWAWPKQTRSTRRSQRTPRPHSPPVTPANISERRTARRNAKLEEKERERERVVRQEAVREQRAFLVTTEGRVNVVYGWFDDVQDGGIATWQEDKLIEGFMRTIEAEEAASDWGVGNPFAGEQGEACDLAMSDESEHDKSHESSTTHWGETKSYRVKIDGGFDMNEVGVMQEAITDTKAVPSHLHPTASPSGSASEQHDLLFSESGGEGGNIAPDAPSETGCTTNEAITSLLPTADEIRNVLPQTGVLSEEVVQGLALMSNLSAHQTQVIADQLRSMDHNGLQRLIKIIEEADRNDPNNQARQYIDKTIQKKSDKKTESTAWITGLVEASKERDAKATKLTIEHLAGDKPSKPRRHHRAGRKKKKTPPQPTENALNDSNGTATPSSEDVVSRQENTIDKENMQEKSGIAAEPSDTGPTDQVAEDKPPKTKRTHRGKKKSKRQTMPEYTSPGPVPAAYAEIDAEETGLKSHIPETNITSPLCATPDRDKNGEVFVRRVDEAFSALMKTHDDVKVINDRWERHPLHSGNMSKTAGVVDFLLDERSVQLKNDASGGIQQQPSTSDVPVSAMKDTDTITHTPEDANDSIPAAEKSVKPVPSTIKGRSTKWPPIPNELRMTNEEVVDMMESFKTRNYRRSDDPRMRIFDMSFHCWDDADYLVMVGGDFDSNYDEWLEHFHANVHDKKALGSIRNGAKSAWLKWKNGLADKKEERAPMSTSNVISQANGVENGVKKAALPQKDPTQEFMDKLMDKGILDPGVMPLFEYQFNMIEESEGGFVALANEIALEWQTSAETKSDRESIVKKKVAEVQQRAKAKLVDPRPKPAEKPSQQKMSLVTASHRAITSKFLELFPEANIEADVEKVLKETLNRGGNVERKAVTMLEATKDAAKEFPNHPRILQNIIKGVLNRMTHPAANSIDKIDVTPFSATTAQSTAGCENKAIDLSAGLSDVEVFQFMIEGSLKNYGKGPKYTKPRDLRILELLKHPEVVHSVPEKRKRDMRDRYNLKQRHILARVDELQRALVLSTILLGSSHHGNPTFDELLMSLTKDFNLFSETCSMLMTLLTRCDEIAQTDRKLFREAAIEQISTLYQLLKRLASKCAHANEGLKKIPSAGGNSLGLPDAAKETPLPTENILDHLILTTDNVIGTNGLTHRETIGRNFMSEGIRDERITIEELLAWCQTLHKPGIFQSLRTVIPEFRLTQSEYLPMESGTMLLITVMATYHLRPKSSFPLKTVKVPSPPKKQDPEGPSDTYSKTSEIPVTRPKPLKIEKTKEGSASTGIDPVLEGYLTRYINDLMDSKVSPPDSNVAGKAPLAPTKEQKRHYFDRRDTRKTMVEDLSLILPVQEPGEQYVALRDSLLDGDGWYKVYDEEKKKQEAELEGAGILKWPKKMKKERLRLEKERCKMKSGIPYWSLDAEEVDLGLGDMDGEVKAGRKGRRSVVKV